ncbi:FxSxx-COOH system tetratricopeptide repeat protein [Nocardia fluminea]|uniref:FxSxx-COOH system tetratricopeptide repeat protein n=1 Tax=Nocardia fluminea TaxID=134984 RepID=UPI00365E1C57
MQSVAGIEAPKGIDNLPLRPSVFVGRATQLNTLDTELTASGQLAVQAVTGLGGVGKSTLVAHWAATCAHAYSPKVWITAADPAEIQQSLADFATRLQPILANVMDVNQLAERGLQWLATHAQWLLILDNVENLTDISDVLARVGTGGRTVVTSRRSTGWQLGTAVVRLDVLDESESLQLLAGLLSGSSPRDEDGAAELCAELGHLPLAIEQAGAYLAQNPFIASRAYLQMLTDHPAETFGQAAVDIDTERTVARIWKVTLDRIADIQPSAAELLRILAWYGPDAIPYTLLQGLANPPTLNSALGVLAAYSMITPDPVAATVSVHRLVQAVARTPDLADPHRRSEAIEHAHAQAATLLHNALPDRKNPATWITWRAMLPHIDALLGHTTTDTATITTILNGTATFFLEQGMFARAIEYLDRALATLVPVRGPNHPLTLNCLENLAGAHQAAGRTADAVNLYEQILLARERSVGPDHHDSLTTRNNLATGYYAMGRTADAVALLEQILRERERERSVGRDDSATLLVRGNLASAYCAAGRLDEAIQLHKQTLTSRERTLGADHPQTLAAQNNLADTYLVAGRTAEAVELFERTVTSTEETLGTDHPQTLAIRNNLASANQKAGRTAEAVALLEQILHDRERVLGQEHPDTVNSRHNLATAYQAAGRIQEAIRLQEATLTDRQGTLGPNHPNTLISQNNLADTYRAAGRHDEALEFFTRTLDGAEMALGEDHSATMTYRNNLASANFAAGRITQAVALLEKVLRDRNRVLGPDHAETIRSGENLAHAYQIVGQTSEAITLLESTFATRERILGPAHPDTIDNRSRLAHSCYQADRTDRAIALYEQNLTYIEQTFGPDHTNTLAALNNLAGAYHAAGRIPEAANSLQKALSAGERLLGSDHPDTQIIRTNLTDMEEFRRGC